MCQNLIFGLFTNPSELHTPGNGCGFTYLPDTRHFHPGGTPENLETADFYPYPQTEKVPRMRPDRCPGVQKLYFGRAEPAGSLMRKYIFCTPAECFQSAEYTKYKKI